MAVGVKKAGGSMWKSKYSVVEVTLDKQLMRFSSGSVKRAVICHNPECESLQEFHLGEKMILLTKRITNGKEVRVALYCSHTCERHARLIFIAEKRRLDTPELEDDGY